MTPPFVLFLQYTSYSLSKYSPSYCPHSTLIMAPPLVLSVQYTRHGTTIRSVLTINSLPKQYSLLSLCTLLVQAHLFSLSLQYTPCASTVRNYLFFSRGTLSRTPLTNRPRFSTPPLPKELILQWLSSKQFSCPVAVLMLLHGPTGGLRTLVWSIFQHAGFSPRTLMQP